MVPDDPERRAVTGGLSLSYAVVPDELAGQLEVRRQVWFVDYAGGDEERTEAELLQLIRPLDLDYALHFSSRLDAYQSIMGSKILALFLGLYLGFTFLLAAAAVLLSDAVVFRTLNVRDFVLAGLCAVLVFGCKAPYREIRR